MKMDMQSILQQKSAATCWKLKEKKSGKQNKKMGTQKYFVSVKL